MYMMYHKAVLGALIIGPSICGLPSFAAEPLFIGKRPLYDFPKGAELRAALSGVLETVDTSLTDLTLSFFAIDADESVAIAAQQISDVNKLALSIGKPFRTRIAHQIAVSPTLVAWKQAIGILAANTLNHALLMGPSSWSIAGLHLIQSFSTLVRAFDLTQTMYISKHEFSQLTAFAHGSDSAESESFCESAGNDIASFLAVAATSVGFKATVVAVKLHALCGPSLTVTSRAESLPASMAASVFPQSPDAEEAVVMVREGMMDASFASLAGLTPLDFKRPIMVLYEDSPAVGSGPRKEWVHAFLEAVFQPSYGLFQYSDEREVYVKPVALTDPASLDKFRQIGRMIGLAISDHISPSIPLTPAAVSFLTFGDSPDTAKPYLWEEDPSYAVSLKRLSVITDPAELKPLELTFDTLYDGGDLIPVTPGNVREYVDGTARLRAYDSIAAQMRALTQGLYDVIPLGQLSFLSFKEVSLLLRGVEDVDVSDLRAATAYEPADSVDDRNPIISWFWDIVSEFANEDKRNLLRFVSGSPFPPVHGFGGMDGRRVWFQIQLDSSLIVNQVPMAQTCFVQLRIPRYTSRAIMRARLLMAIRNTKSLENA